MVTFQEWLANEKMQSHNIPFEVTYNIGRSLDQHAVAIRGSNVFPITHALLASVRHL